MKQREPVKYFTSVLRQLKYRKHTDKRIYNCRNSRKEVNIICYSSRSINDETQTNVLIHS